MGTCQQTGRCWQRDASTAGRQTDVGRGTGAGRRTEAGRLADANLRGQREYADRQADTSGRTDVGRPGG